MAERRRGGDWAGAERRVAVVETLMGGPNIGATTGKPEIDGDDGGAGEPREGGCDSDGGPKLGRTRRQPGRDDSDGGSRTAGRKDRRKKGR